jgi:hypothetical protein
MDEVKTRLQLKSGYTVEVRPLPPYYMDFVETAIPYMDWPRRKLELISGDVVYQRYKPPKEPPLEEENLSEFLLYSYNLEVEEYNKTVDDRRKRAKQDFLFSNCVTVIDGPEDVASDDWVKRVEASFVEYNFKVPPHYGARMLFFLKAVVIRHSDDATAILQAATFQEVSMQGVVSALQNFRP